MPSNALALLKQWTDVHGLPLPPSLKTRVDGYPREVWLSKAGEELIEAYTISNMAHGTPLAVGEGEGACGAPGPFLLPVGISSSYHIAKFFGIALARASADQKVKLSRPPAHAAAEQPVLEGEILTNDEPPRWQQGPNLHRPDIGTVINNALRAAGLIND
jgi:feruloyl esterase